MLDGEADHAYAYSFIATNIEGDVVDIEAWFRQRAEVEERIKDSKCGLALRHLPSGHARVNQVWMWAALLSLNLSTWLQSLGGADSQGRAHAKRLRRELICIPARVLHHARRLVLRSSRPSAGVPSCRCGQRCGRCRARCPDPDESLLAATATCPGRDDENKPRIASSFAPGLGRAPAFALFLAALTPWPRPP